MALEFHETIGGGESVYLSGFGDINWLWVFHVVVLKANIIENV